MLDYVGGIKSSVETFVLMRKKGKFVNVVVTKSPHWRKTNNVAQKVIVMKPKRVVLKKKSYQGMQNVMGSALKELDMLFQPVQIL